MSDDKTQAANLQRTLEQQQQAIQQHQHQLAMQQQQQAIQQSSSQSRFAYEDRNDYRLMILQEDNYTAWKWQMTMVLQSKNLWKYVNDPTVPLDSKANQAAIFLGTTLSENNMLRVINCTTARQIWITLESIYENKSSSEKQMLLSKFHQFKITSINEISKSLGEIQMMAAKLKALGVAIDNETVMSIILNALPESFSTFKTTWNLINSESKDLNKLITAVMAESSSMQNSEERALIARHHQYKENAGLQANSSNEETQSEEGELDKIESDGNESEEEDPDQDKTRKGRCNYCKRPGHWARDCKKLKNKRKKTSSMSHTAMSAGIMF